MEGKIPLSKIGHATAALQELTTCVICFNSFSTERKCKNLNCAHYGCEPCLIEMAAREGNSKVTCMTCRQDTLLSASGVSGLVTNHVIGNLGDIGALLVSAIDENDSERGEGATNAEVALVCGQCAGEGEVDSSPVMASNGCVDCCSEDFPNGMPMCDCCTAAHAKFKGFRTHKVFAIGEFKDRQSSLTQATCTLHSKPLEMYCAGCHVVICLNCSVLTHRNHEIQSIAEAAAEARLSMLQCSAELRGFIDNIVVERDEVRQVSITYNKNVEDALESIKMQAEEIKTVVDIRAANACTEVMQLTEGTAKRLHAHEDALGVIASSATKYCDRAEESSRISFDVELLKSCGAIMRQLQLLRQREKPLDALKVDGVVIVNAPLTEKVLQDAATLFDVKLKFDTKITYLDGNVSLILDDTTCIQLGAMFGKGRVSFTQLITSASGTHATVFDNAVRNHGNVLTLIRSSNNYVFGGFFVDIFGSGGSWRPGNPENFLFSLTGSPFKLLKSTNTNHGIHISSCGLHLGHGDLVAFCSHSCTPNDYRTFAPGYQPIDLQPGTLCGTPGYQNYVPSLMEVYEVSFS